MLVSGDCCGGVSRCLLQECQLSHQMALLGAGWPHALVSGSEAAQTGRMPVAAALVGLVFAGRGIAFS